MARRADVAVPTVANGAQDEAATVVHGLANCDSVKRARAWLQAQDVAYRFRDFKKGGVPPERLDAWIAALGWEALVNRQGTTWRKLDEAARTAVADVASARALMLAAPSVIKRPVVEWPQGRISVGFSEARFADLAAGPGG